MGTSTVPPQHFLPCGLLRGVHVVVARCLHLGGVAPVEQVDAAGVAVQRAGFGAVHQEQGVRGVRVPIGEAEQDGLAVGVGLVLQAVGQEALGPVAFVPLLGGTA